MSRGLFVTRLALTLILVGIGILYVAIRVHERANIVDLEVLPGPNAARDAEPTPVQPRDVSSEDVEEQVEFYPRGGPGCTLSSHRGRPPSIGILDRVTIGARVDVCLRNFVGSGPISLRLPTPTGYAVKDLSPKRVWSWNVPVLPHGRYVLRAIQGDLTAATRIRVGTSTLPLVRVRSFRRKPDLFQVIVSGAPPSRGVSVHLYRAVNSTTNQSDYFSTLTVPTDAHGDGSIFVRGTGGSTYTCYQVAPGFEGQAWEERFCLGSP